MSWRFRKTFKVFPGLRLNLSSSGLSATVGASPLSVNFGPKGVFANVGIPGTGFSFRERLDTPLERVPNTPGNSKRNTEKIDRSIPATREVRSNSTEHLTSEGLEQVRKLLQDVQAERATLKGAVSSADKKCYFAERRHSSWDRGFVFKRLFKKSAAKRREIAETCKAELDELRYQLELTTLATQIDIPVEQAEAYYRMRDEFSALAECVQIWDTLERRDVNRYAERSIATEAIKREPVKFYLAECDLLQWGQKVPHLANRNGGDLYIYPGFVLYRASREAFALIDFIEISLTFELRRFVESSQIPKDSEVIGETWAKSNKDGTPDRRFRDNYQIPVVLYASILLTSPGGLQEEYLFSNPKLAERFARAWAVSQASLLTQRSRTGAVAASDTQRHRLRDSI